MDTHIYKSKLEAEKKNLEAELKMLGIENPRAKEDWIATPGEPVTSEPDSNDLGDRHEDWEERRGTLEALEVRLHNLTRALTKIDEGKFGVCEIGGEEIETDRLSANPAARTCKAHINDESSLTD